jgi:hypothetical protein
MEVLLLIVLGVALYIFLNKEKTKQSVLKRCSGFSLDEIYDAPKGTLHDVIPYGDGSRCYADPNKTINFTKNDLDEAVTFLKDIKNNCSGISERFRKTRKCIKGYEIEFRCQAELIMFARGFAKLLPYWESPEYESLSRKMIYPWSYKGSTALFENPEGLQRNEENFNL